MRVVAILAFGLFVAACTGAASPGSTAPAPSATLVVPTPAPTVAASPTEAPEPARPFPGASQAAEPLPPDRYAATEFTPPFELVLEQDGWSGGAAPGVVALTLDNGYYTRLLFGRFEGTVMPNNCTDERAIIGGSPDALVDWLAANPALSLIETPVSVGGLDGVRLDVHAAVKRPCTADPGKGAPEFLWVDPGPYGAIALDTGERLVAYLLDDGEATVTITFATMERALDPFVAEAEPLLEGVTFGSAGS